MAAPAFVQTASSSTTTASASHTPSPWLTAATAGNLLLIFAGGIRSSGASFTFNTPSGWSSLGSTGWNDATVGWLTLAVFYKIATGGDTAPSMSTASSASIQWLVNSVEAGGADGTTPFDTAGYQVGSNSTGSGNVTAPAITTNGVDRLVMHAALDAWAGLADFSATPPASTTMRFRTGNATSGLAMVMADETAATATTVPTRTFVRSGSTGSISRAVTFAAAPGAAAASTFVPRISII